MRRLIFAVPLMLLLAWGCDPKQYEDYDPHRVFGSWSVLNDSRTFGEFDSLYYLINPILNVEDSLYYNGDYTDSYYDTDSTRVALKYSTGDSIFFNFDRMYAVQINPSLMVMHVKVDEDTLKRSSVLHLKKMAGSDKIFCCGPDSLFKELLMTGKIIKATATNDSSTSQPQGSQNYRFVLPTAGFEDAFRLADSLNTLRNKPVDGKCDSLKIGNDTHKFKHDASTKTKKKSDKSK